MNKDWEVKKLGEVCSFENGDRGTNYPSRSKRTVKGIPFINAGHLINNGIDIDNLSYISKKRFNLLGSGKIRSGDVLFCLRGSLGKFACVGNLSEGAIASSLVIVRPNGSIIDKFLTAYFQSQLCANMISLFRNGAAQPNLSAGSLGKFEIPLPPFPTQKRIVAILDEAFSAIAKAKEYAERNLQNTRELYESYLQSVFANPGDNWEEKNLGEISIIKGGKRVPKGYRLVTERTNHPYIRVTDFNNYGSVDLDDIHYINDKIFKQIQNYTISVNDLYISIAGTIGKTGIIPKELDGANLTENACRLVFVQNIDTRLIYYFTKSSLFLDQAGLNTRVTAMPKLALSRLSTIKINIPKSISEQKSIVAKLDTLSAETKNLEAIYQQKLADLDELKKSILQKAFSGELTEE